MMNKKICALLFGFTLLSPVAAFAGGHTGAPAKMIDLGSVPDAPETEHGSDEISRKLQEIRKPVRHMPDDLAGGCSITAFPAASSGSVSVLLGLLSFAGALRLARHRRRAVR